MAESSLRLFKGAQVRNVQGGPTMIIDALSEHLAICHWYAEGRLHEGLFSPKTLRLHQEGQQTCLWPELNAASSRDTASDGLVHSAVGCVAACS